MKKEQIPEISSFKRRLPVQLRFNDIDMFGHLNNTVYLQFLDQGKYDYFRSFMHGTFGSEPTAPVVANINVDFHQPSFIDDKLTVLTAITQIAESSMQMEQLIIDDKDNIKCSARTIMVNIDMHTGKSTPVYESWRAKLSEFEHKTF